jgi:tRNA modification GTPase
VIEVHLDLHGLPVTLLDTAGIRETDDPVEREGVQRARARAAAADLILWVVETGDPTRVGDDRDAGRLSPFSSSGNRRTPVWLVRNKIDLPQGASQRNELKIQGKGKTERSVRVNKPLKNVAKKRLTEKSEIEFTSHESEFNISARTGEGFDALLGALARCAESFLAGTESALVTRERHRLALQDAVTALRRALAPDLSNREDLLAEELRLAARALGRLVGRVDVDDVLDVIFRDFCIGK